MSNDSDIIRDAKKSIKHHIKFLESLKQNISFGSDEMKHKAIWATYCLHRYMNDKLMDDIQAAIKQQVVDGGI